MDSDLEILQIPEVWNKKKFNLKLRNVTSKNQNNTVGWGKALQLKKIKWL